MFDNLIESQAAKQRRAGGFLWSFVIHGILISAAVYATYSVGNALEKPKAEKVEFVTVKKDEPPPPKEEKPPPPEVVMKAPPPKGFQVLTAPVDIPDVLPDIDLTKSVTNENDFTGKGAQGGFAKGTEKKVEVKEDQTYFEFQVEKPVMTAPGSGQPRYPDILRQAGVEGDVLATFVVDTTGRADPASFKVLRTSHELFSNAVKQALPSMRFIPAEVGGKKVKQLVQQPFSFAITK